MNPLFFFWSLALGMGLIVVCIVSNLRKAGELI